MNSSFKAGWWRAEPQELKEGGRDIAVTNANRREYVDRLVDYILKQSIQEQYGPFSEGFLMMFDPEVRRQPVLLGCHV